MRTRLSPAAPGARMPRLVLHGTARAAVLAFAMLLALPSPAFSQVPGNEDLRALIYYLDHNDQRSVQAEMRRLRAQYPTWTPPTDLNELRGLGQGSSAVADVAGIWARIERGDNTGARALIDQTRATVPGWSPDAEMLRVLDINEGQAAFDAAVARRDSAAAIAAARRSPALMRCDRINNAWQLAEMYQIAGQTDNAVATYRGVLGACTRAADAVPTLEKANEIASLEQLSDLFQAARTANPGNTQPLNELEARLRAGRGAPAATAAAPRAAAPAQAAAAAPTMDTPIAAAAPVNLPVNVGDLPARGDARLAQVRSRKEAGDWVGCMAQSTAPRSLEVLYERAWCAYNLDRSGEAMAGFTAVSRAGNALGGDVARDSRFGLVLAQLSFNMTEEAARLAAATDLTRDQRLEVETIILDQRGVRSYQMREYARAVAYFDALEALTGTLRRDLAMLRAYGHANLGNYEIAREQFTRLHNQLATDETREALQSLATAGVENG